MKFTPLMAGSMSGSMGGCTASHNKGGPYFRRRAVPTNPNTTRQQAIRTAMGAIANHWSTQLTEPELQAWRDYAANTPVTNTLGQTITLSGANIFARWNVVQQQLAIASGVPLTIQNAAPTTFNTGSPITNVDSFSGVFTTPPGTVSVSYSVAGLASDDGDVLVYIAPPQTLGTRFYKGPYQLAAVDSITAADDAGTIGPITIATAWWSSTTPIAAWDGLQIPVKVRILYDDGRLSETWRALVPFLDATP